VTGTIDEVSYETRSSLEIYDVQLQSHSPPLLLGSLTTKDCFHSVAWGSKGVGTAELSHGLIAGGMRDGAVNIWSAGAIIKRSASAASSHNSSPPTPSHASASNSALLCRSEQHKGQVHGLQFHPTQPNLLASGGGDGLVLVWDLADVRQPKANKPNPALTGVEHGVTCVGWNKKVPQILASSNESGETTVWDLRQKKCQSHTARLTASGQLVMWRTAVLTVLRVVCVSYVLC
jgi:protein transport protein SEC31